ncbi:MAG: YsnF/AvaK domain-containing protein, partial [Janthinobacterium lividum]
VEEQLVVGKREVDRGGARVRSYVTETAVHEQIKLRDEKINVQRRAVDRPITDADDAFRERTIDMTATGEEAVVGKTARVVEEVVVSKTRGEHVEQIDDTVRRTDVEIDEDAGRTSGTSVDPTYKR